MRVAERARQGSRVQAGYRSSSPAPFIDSVFTANWLAKISWTPPFSQTSAVVKLEAAGQATLEATLGAEVTTVTFNDGVTPWWLGVPVVWTLTVTVLGSAGKERSQQVGVVPSLVKPSTTIIGVPVGAEGDFRTPAPALTPITAVELEAVVKAGAELAVYENLEVSGQWKNSANKQPTFINCLFLDRVRFETGGVFYTATFIDCEVRGQPHAATIPPSNTIPLRLVRCDLSGGTDCVLFGWPRPQQDQFVLSSMIHELRKEEGGHADPLQWSNATGATKTGNAGVAIGTYVEGSSATGENVNSIMELGSSWHAGDSITVDLDHCWFDGPDVPSYGFHGPAPESQVAGAFKMRNGFVGLNTGATNLFYSGFSGPGKNMLWENMVWEKTGTTADGREVVAGQPVPIG